LWQEAIWLKCWPQTLMQVLFHKSLFE
jgi:hypothetical protein